MEPPAAEPAPPACGRGNAGGQGWRALFGRLALAHFLAYPMIYVSAAAALPLAIFVREEQLLAVSGQTQPDTAFQRWLIREVQLSAENAASFEVIIIPIAWLLLVMFVLTHATAVPWALAAKRARETPSEQMQLHEVRARKLWLWSSLAPTVAVVLIGLIGWLRIFLM